MSSVAPPIEFASAESHYCDVRGARIHYRTFGRGNTPGPGLLFIHGMWAHSHWWDHIVPYFRDDYRVAAMDLAGMGDSHRRSQYTVRGFAQDIVAIIQSAGIAPCTLVAHSFGGSPSIVASHLSPESIARVIVVDSRLNLPNLETAQRSLMTQMPTPRPYASRQQAIDRYRLIPAGDVVDPALLEHIAATGLREVEGGWIWKFDPLLNPRPTSDPDQLIPPGITTPIDFVYGECSEVVDRSVAAQIAAYFPNCGSPICIPGMHHHFLLEHPTIFIAVLRSLLSRSPTR